MNITFYTYHYTIKTVYLMVNLKSVTKIVILSVLNISIALIINADQLFIISDISLTKLFNLSSYFYHFFVKKKKINEKKPSN